MYVSLFICIWIGSLDFYGFLAIVAVVAANTCLICLFPTEKFVSLAKYFWKKVQTISHASGFSTLAMFPFTKW